MKSSDLIKPFISIIIPTFNRPKQLVTCLKSLSKLDYSHDHFEIVVVDDGSHHCLNAAVEPFKNIITITLIRQLNSGPASARNTGARSASGQFLVFTDDDCCLAEDWLSNIVKCFEASPNSMLGGYTVNALEENTFAVTSQLIVDIVYSFYNKTPEQSTFITSNNMAMPSSIFNEIGGFDTSFPKPAAEDRDLCDRWVHAGYQIVYVPEITVFHYHELTFLNYCKQHFNYGRGACHFHRIRALRGSGNIGEVIGFHSQAIRLLRKPLANFSFVRMLKVCMLLIVWQVANAAGFFYEKFRHTKL